MLILFIYYCQVIETIIRTFRIGFTFVLRSIWCYTVYWVYYCHQSQQNNSSPHKQKVQRNSRPQKRQLFWVNVALSLHLLHSHFPMTTFTLLIRVIFALENTISQLVNSGLLIKRTFTVIIRRINKIRWRFAHSTISILYIYNFQSRINRDHF